MFDERLQFALDNFLVKDYFVKMDSSYNLTEKGNKKENIKPSLLTLKVGTEDNLCVQHYDIKPRCSFLNNDDKIGMQKCIDHFILRKREGHWELHMIEMKTTVGFFTWFDVKYKMRTSYLNIKALAVFLGISLEDENIFAYTTYNKNVMKIADMDSPKTILPKIGGRAIDLKKEEWDADFINIPIIGSDNPYDFKTVIKLKHTKIKMYESNDGKQFEGIFSL